MGAFSPTASAEPLLDANANMDRVCTGGQTGVADVTSAANDGDQNVVTMGGGNVPTEPTTVYIGMKSVFDTLKIQITTAATGEGALDWYYWATAGYAKALAVDDPSNHLRTTGLHTITFTPPSDWSRQQLPGSTGNACSGSHYYVQATTAIDYLSGPKASQISAVAYNLHVKVRDEIGNALLGLYDSAFAATGGTTNTVFGVRELGNGDYALALDTAGADHSFVVTASKDGYVRSAGLSTEDLTTALTDRTSNPLSLSFAYKVPVLVDELASGISGATVLAGDGYSVSCQQSGAAYYCPVPLSHTSTSVRAIKQGYVTVTGSFGADRTSHADTQRTVSLFEMAHTVKITVASLSDLSGVTFERKSGSGPYATVLPSATSGANAYFAAAPDDGDQVYRATKGGAVGTSGAAFTPTSAGQTAKTIGLAVPTTASTNGNNPTTTTRTAENEPLPAPTGLTAVGVEGGVLRTSRLQLGWDPVPGAEDYVVHTGTSSQMPLDASTLRGSTAASGAFLDEPRSGLFTYAVMARDSSGQPGLPAYLHLDIELADTASRLSTPGQTGPAIPVEWDLAGIASDVLNTVEIWVWEDGQVPRRILTTTQLAGSIGFYGIEGHTYKFQARLIDPTGDNGIIRFTEDRVDSLSSVVSNRVTASNEALDAMGESLVPGREPFFAEDLDLDGFPETFRDPANQLQLDRTLELLYGDKAMLLNDLLRNLPSLLWDPAKNQADPVTHVPPVNVRREGTGYQPETVAVVDKGGWIFVPIPDYHPDRDILRVERQDGTELMIGYYWRADGFISLVDDPSTEYRVIYGEAPPVASFWSPWIITGIVTGLLLLLWVEAPGTRWLGARARKATGLWFIFHHCRQCRDPLPRTQRLMRWLHRCPRFSTDMVQAPPAAAPPPEAGERAAGVNKFVSVLQRRWR